MSTSIEALAASSGQGPSRKDGAEAAIKLAQSMLFETLLKSSGLQQALVPASMEGTLYGDFFIQKLAQDLAAQLGGRVTT